MTRGVLYMKWGKVDEILGRSVESLKRHHPELPVHVHECPPQSNLLVKTAMADITPFDQTLFLDIDTVVLGRLDYAFDKAEKFGLACCICENPWARRHRGLWNRGDLIEYNTGVLFFTRTAKAVFDQWKELAPRVDSATEFIALDGQPSVLATDDQGSFAAAVEEAVYSPFVLPMNWNWRPPIQNSFFGPIKIYHGYPPPIPSLEEWNRAQNAPRAVLQYAWLPNETPGAVAYSAATVPPVSGSGD